MPSTNRHINIDDFSWINVQGKNHLHKIRFEYFLACPCSLLRKSCGGARLQRLYRGWAARGCVLVPGLSRAGLGCLYTSTMGALLLALLSTT